MSGDEKLEERLREALKREAAPDGFAERVLARVAQQEVPKEDARKAAARGLFGFGWLQAPVMRFGAVAAMAVAVVAGTLVYRQHERERAEGEAARQQLMLALRITGSKLQYAQQKVQEVSSQQYGPECTSSPEGCGTRQGDRLQ